MSDLLNATRDLTRTAGTPRARTSFGGPPPSAAPGLGERTQMQHVLDGAEQDLVDRRKLIAAGFSDLVEEPGGYELLPGGYATWRLMDSNATLALVRAVMAGPIFASGWQWKKRDPSIPDAVLNFVKAVYDPIRPVILRDAIYATSMGWQPFEQIWRMERHQGQWMYAPRFKPLDQEMTYVETCPETGRFAGLRQGAAYLPPVKVWMYTHDFIRGGWYGRPRHENCRAEFSEYLFVNRNARRLVKKVSGIIPIIRYIKGQMKNANGQDVDNFTVAMSLIGALANAKGVAFESLAYDADEIRNNPEKLKQAAMEIDTVDVGQSYQAIGGVNERCAQLEKQFCRAWGRPERAVIEATTAGSRADSDAAMDVSITDSEQVHGDIVRCLNWHSIDDTLAINFGPEYRGAVYAEPSPIIDANKQVLKDLFTALTQNPGMFEQVMADLDRPALYEALRLPVQANAGREPATPSVTDGTPTPAADAAAAATFAQAHQN